MQLVAFTGFIRSHLSDKHFWILFRAFAVLVTGLLVLVGAYLSAKGVIAPFAGRFYSLWDTNYAKIHIPIIASVSEHQPTAWASFFFDLNLLVVFFPAGVYLCFRELRDEHVFVILYSVFASYFAGVMVRLMLTLTPIVTVTAGVAIAELLRTFATKVPSGGNGGGVRAPELKYVVGAVVAALLAMFAMHSTWDGSQVIIDDFREAYYWLRQNTAQDAKIMAWWDYGYQLAGMADRATLVDNNTWNNTHIATVGLAMASPEDQAYEIMRRHHVDYVLVIFGGVLGYSGDDINKFLWMIRIGEGVYPDKVSERKFFTDRGEYRVDDAAPPAMRNSLLYKTSYYRFHDIYGKGNPAYDRVRGTQIATKPIKLHTLDEAYTSENWIVRIYQVKKPDVLGRPLRDVQAFEEGRRRRRRAGRATGGGTKP
ncbi:oligosaccharyltransferase subunit Stt3 [Blastocladiella britannica]|nr:oligosaccharyltransferase subunit Stt3 [Blastocladiella britannica]